MSSFQPLLISAHKSILNRVLVPLIESLRVDRALSLRARCAVVL